MSELAMSTMAAGVLTTAFGNALYWLFMALFLMKVFALVDAAFRREDAYRAADKQKKPFWLIILGLAVALDLLIGGILSIAGLIAAIVYLVDVRPALKQVGGRRGGSSGPYGPW
jgi:hypothetical protein